LAAELEQAAELERAAELEQAWGPMSVPAKHASVSFKDAHSTETFIFVVPRREEFVVDPIAAGFRWCESKTGPGNVLWGTSARNDLSSPGKPSLHNSRGRWTNLVRLSRHSNR
jgi:hypothetical protein